MMRTSDVIPQSLHDELLRLGKLDQYWTPEHNGRCWSLP
jgi:hypothetical protein